MLEHNNVLVSHFNSYNKPTTPTETPVIFNVTDASTGIWLPVVVSSHQRLISSGTNNDTHQKIPPLFWIPRRFHGYPFLPVHLR
jgi:hypothetical protein